MSDHIKLFNTMSEFNAVRMSKEYAEPWVSYVKNVGLYEVGGVSYNKTEESIGLETPLTFNIISGGTIKWVASHSATTKTIEYKLNNGEWTEITSDTWASAPSISVEAGDKVQFRGENHQYGNNSGHTNIFSTSGVKFEVLGNALSLVYPVNYATTIGLWSSYTFCSLFKNCAGVTSAEKLLLPATVLTPNCYSEMFRNCAYLTAAPAILPASSATQYCYNSMFNGCSSLTKAPELPATVLGDSCYASMFYGCTKLTSIPAVLPATTYLNKECYKYMFSDCRSLTTAPALPATALTSGMIGCYSGMFAGCTSLVNAPELPAVTIVSSCYDGMFSGCTSLVQAPDLPATVLGAGCYSSMFRGCTALTSAPSILPATTLAIDCYGYMFAGCKNLTTAPVLPGASLFMNSYRYMFSGCTNLNYIKCLATNISASNCTYEWVNGVASTGTFVKDKNMTSWTTGINGIPSNWTVEDAS